MKKDNQIIKADWSLFIKRPTWGYVSTPELTKIFGVSLQSINNWILRGKLPKPSVDHRFRGNKNWWQIGCLRSWLENKSEEQVHWEWIKQHMPKEDFKSIGQAQFLVKHCYDLLEVEKA